MHKANGQFLQDMALQVTLGSQYQAATELPEALAQFLHALPEVASTDKTRRILQLLTAQELYRRAGYQPIPLSNPELLQTTCDVAAPDFMTPALQQLFQQLQHPGLSSLPWLLWKYWLQAAIDARATLPYALAPQFFTLFSNMTVLQPLALQVLNSRSRWLAAQQDIWRWATLPQQVPQIAHSDQAVAAELPTQATFRIEEAWTGLGDKLQLLQFRLYRQQQPVLAAGFLQQQWPTLAAEQREKLLALLAVQLEPADSDFLQRVLAEDRSTYVRQQAALLLASLPQSACFRNLQELFGQCVSLDAQGQLQFMPQDAVWQQCQQVGIDPKTISIYWRQSAFKRAVLGQQGLNIHLLCSLFPLDCWHAIYPDPAQCLAAIEKSIWRESMLLGVIHACMNQQSRIWADALISYASVFVLQPECIYEQGELMKLASPVQRDQLLLGQVDALASHYLHGQLQKSWNDVFSSLGQHTEDTFLRDETATQLMTRIEKRQVHQHTALWLQDVLLVVAGISWLQQNLSRFDESQVALFRLRTALIAQSGQH